MTRHLFRRLVSISFFAFPNILFGQRIVEARAGIIPPPLSVASPQRAMTPSMSRENRKLVGLAAGIGIGLGIVAVRHRGGHYNGLPDVLIIDPIIVLGCGFLVGSWAAGPR